MDSGILADHTLLLFYDFRAKHWHEVFRFSAWFVISRGALELVDAMVFIEHDLCADSL